MTYNERTQDNPMINWQDGQKITFCGSAYPKDISLQCTTYRSSAPPGALLGILGSSIPVSDH